MKPTCEGKMNLCKIKLTIKYGLWKVVSIFVYRDRSKVGAGPGGISPLRSSQDWSSHDRPKRDITGNLITNTLKKCVWPKNLIVCFPRAVNAVPCRIAFERGKERHFCFLAISVGTSGWLVLAEELPLKKPYGIVRVAAPLSGCNVCIVVCYPCILILKHAVLLAENCTNLCWLESVNVI